MKKEILPVLAFLLAMAFPLAALAEHDPQKDLKEDSALSPAPDAKEALAAKPLAATTLAVALPAASAPKECGQECLDAYKKYTSLVASQEWNVALYKEFLKRFDEVSSGVKVTDDSKDLLVGSMPVADWHSSYKYREAQMDKKAAWDGVVTMFQVERADFGRGQTEAEKLYKKFAGSTTWSDGGQVKKALGRHLSDKDLYGKNVLAQGHEGDGVRVFPGAMAAANLRAVDFLYVYLGPEGRNSLDSSYCKKDKCAPGLVEDIDKRNQLQKKGGKAIADVSGAGLGSGAAAGGAAAGAPKFSESFLKTSPSASVAPAVAAAPALSILPLDHDHAIASTLGGGHLNLDSLAKGWCTADQAMDKKCKLGEPAPCAKDNYFCQSQRSKAAVVADAPPPAVKTRPLASKPVVAGLVAQPKWGTVTEYKMSAAAALQQIAWDDGTQLLSSKPIDPAGNTYGFSGGSVVEYTKGGEDWRFSVSGSGFSINKQPAPTLDQLKGNTKNVRGRRIAGDAAPAKAASTGGTPPLPDGSAVWVPQTGVWRYSNGMILDPKKNQVYDPGTHSLAQCDANNQNCTWTQKTILLDVK